MITIFLIALTVVFYQLFSKAVMIPATTTGQPYNQKQKGPDLQAMWRAMEQYQAEKTAQAAKQQTKKNTTFSKSTGFQGGEYIDFEEIE